MSAAGRPLRIGLTGPIGCGKSTVAGWLAQAGGTVIDADELAHAVTAPGQPALGLIRRRFGYRVIDRHGFLIRDALAEIVFQDPDALRDLEAIVHPRVRERIEAAVVEADRLHAPFVVIEAIKLVEGGYADVCDEVWLIECRRETQVDRLKLRGYGTASAERRIAAQGDDLAERLSEAATRRIATDGSLEATRRSVLAALAEARSRVDQGAG